jgi:phosphatidate cytidylyltransferase
LKTLLIRALTGAVFVGLTVGSILLGQFSFLVFFLVTMLYTTYEFYRLCQIRGDKPHVVLGLIISAYIFVAVFTYRLGYLGLEVFILLLPLLMSIPIFEVFKKHKRRTLNISFTILGIVYVAIPFSILNLIATHQEVAGNGWYSPLPTLGLFIILWASDTGAYLVGSQIGKYKMAAKISPNKTWEGAIGGGILAIVVAIVFAKYSNLFTVPQAIIASIITVVAGTLGDLSESMFKRSFNVKDSGKIMPGHGGLLDRFDSLLFSAPVYYFYLIVIQSLKNIP